MSFQPGGEPRLTPMKCSTCGRKFFLQQSPTPPFCSERCQLIDLGKWLNEDIGVPFEGDPTDELIEYRDDDRNDSRDDDRDDRSIE